jgi:predicted RNase H-like nuclease
VASLLQQQVEAILDDRRSSQYNIPGGVRLYSEILQDPKTTYPALLHTVEEWVRDPALKRPSEPSWKNSSTKLFQ